MGIYAGVNGFVAIGVLSAVAWVTAEPFVFPSLGPTAFLLFWAPTTAAASPRNTVLGHAIGAAAGYLALLVFGLTDAPPALTSEVTGGRIGAAAMSLALTSAVMIWTRTPHPPAGATTLIVSLGILRDLDQLAILMLAVVLLSLQGVLFNRAAGIDFPLWRAAPSPPRR
jgi:CBS-domain-containing membrane protein